MFIMAHMSNIIILISFFFYSVNGFFQLFSHVMASVEPNNISIAITTKNGVIIGRPKYTYEKQQLYYSFQGIPYAAPPVGEKRFEKPEPPNIWNKPYLSFYEKAECSQMNGIFMRGDEDCLYLNIYTPELLNFQKPNRKAVMVWIHGGDFITGSGNTKTYCPDFFIEKDVVFVTFNYRLGIFGFLSTQDNAMPGNVGLRDQIAALQWIQENIESFNGDKNSITIFGESAGAASVHFLILSPLTRGLFHRAICQSGTSLSKWSIKNNSKKVAFNTGWYLGIFTKYSEYLIKKLKDISTWILIRVSLLSAFTSEFNPLDGMPFTPCVDGFSKDPVIPQNPIDLLKQGKFNPIPLIIGYNSQEALMVTSVTRSNLVLIPYQQNPELLIPSDLNIQWNSAQAEEILNKIKKFYFSNVSIASMDNFINFTSDIDFSFPIYRTAELHSKLNPETYMYIFSFEGNMGAMRNSIPSDMKGVSHYDEIGYQFCSNLDEKPDIPSLLTRDRIITMWTNFAKTGNPTPIKDHLLQNIIWPKIHSKDDKNVHYLEINNDLELKINPAKEAMKLWNEIYTKYSSNK